jgi:broad specificity phosphatase PhoE
VRLFVVARHAQSTLNLEQRVNGDPSRPVGLTDLGKEEARELAIQVANVPLDACVHTRFSRTRETAEIALGGREVEWTVEPLLDDVDVGDLDGRPIDEYRAWKHGHPRSAAFPGGESLDEAAARYAEGWAAVLASRWERVFVVCHEIPLRYALNAAAGSDSLDGPIHELRNATPYVFDEAGLARAVDGMRALLPARAPV